MDVVKFVSLYLYSVCLRGLLTPTIGFCYYLPLLSLLSSFSHPERAPQVTNFSASWSDGKAFCVVIYDYNARMFSYSELKGKESECWLEYAFQFAYEKVSVERLLDAEGMYFLKGCCYHPVVYDRMVI